MSLTSVALIFLCGLAWSLFDLSRKRMGHSLPVFRSLFLFMWVQLPVFAVGTFFEKSLYLDEAYWLPGLAGIAMNFLANSLFIWSVSIAPLSHTVPMLSFTCVVSALSSYFLLGETLDALQILGIVLVTAGAFLLNGPPSFRDAEKKGAWLMGLASIFWGSMAVVDKICLQSTPSTVHATIQTAGIAVVVTLILWRRKEMGITLRTAPSQAYNLGLGTLASSSAILLQLHIIQSVAVGLFEAVKRVIAMGLAVFWGRLLYREQITRAKVFSLLLMALGLLFLLTPRAAHANVWDASFDAGLRSYPSGAALGLEGGHSTRIWGAPSEGIQYGFTRVGARVQSSGVVNRLDTKLSVFPIAFAGLELSTGFGHRNLEKISTLDCTLAQCDGALTRTQLSVPVYFGAGPYFGRLKFDYSWVAATNATKELLVDESSNLYLRASGDQLRRWEIFVGLRLPDNIRPIVFFDKTRAMKTGSSSQTYGVLGQKSWDEHSLIAGLGVYESTTTSAHGQFLVAYKLTFAKGMGL